MIRIPITAEAYEALAATPPLVSRAPTTSRGHYGRK
jgi:hypothetical protein